jgi:hypothetical protein
MGCCAGTGHSQCGNQARAGGALSSQQRLWAGNTSRSSTSGGIKQATGPGQCWCLCEWQLKTMTLDRLGTVAGGLPHGLFSDSPG